MQLSKIPIPVSRGSRPRVPYALFSDVLVPLRKEAAVFGVSVESGILQQGFLLRSN